MQGVRVVIRFAIYDAKIAKDGLKYALAHPSNGAILAYCDTKEEAERARDAINDLALQLRRVGEVVK